MTILKRVSIPDTLWCDENFEMESGFNLVKKSKPDVCFRSILFHLFWFNLSHFLLIRLDVLWILVQKYLSSSYRGNTGLLGYSGLVP